MRCAIRRGLCLPPAPWVMTGTRWGSVLSQHHHFFHHQRGYKGMFLKKIWCSAKQARRRTFFFALDYLKSWGPHWGSNLVAILIFWTCMSLSTAMQLHQAVMCGPYYMYLLGRKFSWSFSESYCEALAPWCRVIYLAGEETLPLWKHSSNRWRQPNHQHSHSDVILGCRTFFFICLSSISPVKSSIVWQQLENITNLIKVWKIKSVNSLQFFPKLEETHGRKW